MSRPQGNYFEISCDLCGSSDAVEVPHAREYTGDQPIHICKKCGLVYVKERRKAEEVAKSWSESIFGDHYTARIPAVKARQTFVADFIDVSVGLMGKSLCDIGAGEGQFLEIARRDYGAWVFGTEACQLFCEMMTKADIPCYNGTVENFAKSDKVEDHRADIVTMMWTLECCASARDMLAAAYQILKPNGYVCVATGSRILVPFKKPLNLYLSDKPADAYPIRCSANTQKSLLAVSGFETTHVNRYLDSDVLCVIAQKREPGAKIPWQGDDYRRVADFFERWHRETVHYR